MDVWLFLNMAVVGCARALADALLPFGQIEGNVQKKRSVSVHAPRRHNQAPFNERSPTRPEGRVVNAVVCKIGCFSGTAAFQLRKWIN